MSTDKVTKLENTVSTVLAFVAVAVLVAVVLGILALFYDMGQLSGYCKAEGAKVEEAMCVKNDTIIKRGSDI